MRAFACTNCGQLAYFENERCEACGSELGFQPQTLELVALRPLEDGSGAYEAIGSGEIVRHCANHQTAGCNWLTPGDAPGLCESCVLGRRIPDLGVPENVALWREAEIAKRRLVYALKRLGLPLARPDGAPLVFDILSDAAEAQPVMTGHDDGLITINLAEADPAERERRRHDLGEVYRTLLGHFRHEVGHFYWDALVRDGGREDACRQVFGDDRLDYEMALKNHYANGAPADWQMSFVSPYATMHPWEDFAETWAHYMHIVDALDTAAAFRMRGEARGLLRPEPRGPGDGRPLHRRFDGGADRRMAAALLCGQQPQPQHGPAGSLSLRAVRARHRQAQLRACAGARGGGGLRRPGPIAPAIAKAGGGGLSSGGRARPCPPAEAPRCFL